MQTPSLFRLPKIILLVAINFLVFSCNTEQQPSGTYYVAKSGSDANKGTAEAPFLTINHAAQMVMPGDEVIVGEGTYREWVKPARGGNSEESRITYKAAPGAEVKVLGSEQAKGWTDEGNGIWKIMLEDAFFGDFNPFKTLSRHPQEVGVDESGDGWGWLKYGRWTHLGDVIINGKGLTEKQTKEELSEYPFSWFTESVGKSIHIYANFRDANPNKEQVELNARGFAFFPEKTGLNYITVKGFTFMNVANHWAPPTVFQPAAVGPNGGHHWIMEDNIILYAKAAAISIGIPNESFEPQDSGHHIIRNNVIMRCGQGGITGQVWSSKSEIYNNHIEAINYRKEFGGWETAAIKLHGADSLIVKGNFINGVSTMNLSVGAAHGIWNDYQNSNWLVSENLVMNTEGHGILAEANWEGPNLYANNIILDASIGIYSSRGDAWVHNLFINSEQKWENQPWGDRVRIGNARWFNNMFIGKGFDPTIEEDSTVYDSNVLLDSATAPSLGSNSVFSQTPTDYKSTENGNGIIISFTIDKSILVENYPFINSEKLNLPFSYDPTVNTDYDGKKRTGQQMPGPFSELVSGENKKLIYEFTPLYKKALELLDQNP